MTFQKEAKNLDIFRRFDLTLTALFIALQMLKIVKIFLDDGHWVEGWLVFGPMVRPICPNPEQNKV